MGFDPISFALIKKVIGSMWNTIKQKLESEGAKNKIYDSDIDGIFDSTAIPNLDASKITTGIFDIARIPDLTRSKITDFFNTPFWNNIPDKPSTFPPSLHASDHSSTGSDPITPSDIGAIDSSEKGAANGVCELDASALIPLTRIPSTLTGKDADSVDGYQGTDLEKIANKGVANGYCDLDASALVPLTRLPAIPPSKLSAIDSPADGELLSYDSASGKFEWIPVSSAGGFTVVTKTANYTASNRECILVDASTGAITITLPTPSAGAEVIVKKIDSTTNSVTIAQSGTESIDGAASQTLNTQWEAIHVISDGTNWYII
jgi:hypothetical protein